MFVLGFLKSRFFSFSIDQVAVPDFGAGAMENWGLVIYREIYLLWSETESSVYNKHRVAHVIGHELAHQVMRLLRQFVPTNY